MFYLILPIYSCDFVRILFSNMLQPVQYKMNVMKTRSRHFSTLTYQHIPVDHSISNTLQDRPISHNTPSIFAHYFLIVQITVPTPIFITPFSTFCWEPKLVYFCNFFVNLIKRNGKLKSPKTAIFDFLESFFHSATGFFVLFVNICHIVFRIATPFVWCSQKWTP